jgi:Tfp pilus assembly protein PilF
MSVRACLFVMLGLTVPAAAMAAAPGGDHLPLVPPKTVPLPGARSPSSARPVAQPVDPQVRLDRLYDRLAAAKSPEEAEEIASIITALHRQAGSDTAELLTSRALDELKRKDTDAALKLFDAVLAVVPAYAEAWNQRAMIYYREGDYRHAMADLREVLRREPRHWGAWEALGRILEQTGDEADALGAYRRALAVDPQLKGLQGRVDRLAVRVNGRQL